MSSISRISPALSGALMRRLVLERDGRRCLVCSSPDDLVVHHRSYARLGHELLADLATLCRDCHELFHAQS